MSWVLWLKWYGFFVTILLLCNLYFTFFQEKYSFFWQFFKGYVIKAPSLVLPLSTPLAHGKEYTSFQLLQNGINEVRILVWLETMKYIDSLYTFFLLFKFWKLVFAPFFSPTLLLFSLLSSVRRVTFGMVISILFFFS